MCLYLFISDQANFQLVSEWDLRYIQVIMYSLYNPKSSAASKIPPFDEDDFSIWKSKAMDILEIMDYYMLDVINKGPIAPMHHSTSDDVPSRGLKQKSMLGYNKEEKRLINLDVKTIIAIGNSFPYHVYRLVQNYTTSQNMMITLTSTFDKEWLSDDEFHKDKCLIVRIDDLHSEVSTFGANLSQVAKDSNSQDWDSSSMY